ncbi:hypothetical protein LT337_03295 [Mycolicibacterium fortuitum]|nr:hypothetical protein LT337_03295 [Mycolicibacterium fortuitum]
MPRSSDNLRRIGEQLSQDRRLRLQIRGSLMMSIRDVFVCRREPLVDLGLNESANFGIAECRRSTSVEPTPDTAPAIVPPMRVSV